MSGLALSRRHQGHCNEIDRAGEGGGAGWKGGRVEGEGEEMGGQQTEVSDVEERRP